MGTFAQQKVGVMVFSANDRSGTRTPIGMFDCLIPISSLLSVPVSNNKGEFGSHQSGRRYGTDWPEAEHRNGVQIGKYMIRCSS